MYKKFVRFKDKKSFGNEVIVFRSEENFLIIIIERGTKAYYFVDIDVEYLYPVDSYMKNINFVYDEKSEKAVLDYSFDIDLKKYGSTRCPEWLKSLIKSN